MVGAAPPPPGPLRAPLTFDPALRDYVWGGRNLARLFGRPLPPGVVAESWEVSGHATAPTTVDQGPLHGCALPELVARFGEALLGRKGVQAAGATRTFPLLVKLLDACRPLSVQVHPGDAQAAARRPNERGKTEAWYVLHAEPDAEVVVGLRPEVGPEDLRQAVAAGQVEACLNRTPVRAGDAVLVPAGTVHAILPGVVLAEVQQSSDVTYRLYDWGRTRDPGAPPRELHVAEALEAVRWPESGLGQGPGSGQGQASDRAQGPGSASKCRGRPARPGVQAPRLLRREAGLQQEVVAQCDKFVVERLTLNAGGAYEGELAGDTFEIWGVLSGTVSVGPTTLNAVRFALLPAVMGAFRAKATESAAALRIYLP